MRGLGRLLVALLLGVSVILLPSAASWAQAPASLTSPSGGLYAQSAPAGSAAPSPTTSPASEPTSTATPTVVVLSDEQFSVVGFGFGLLVLLSSASVVAGWRR